MTENIKDNEVKEPTEEKDKTSPREPSNNDFMAGAILANGIIWLWIQSLSMFSDFMERIPPAILTDLSYVTFILAGFISSQQVAKRSDKNQLIVALKSSFFSWVGSVIMMLSMPSASVTFAIILFVCLMLGGVTGSYMLVRDRIIARRRRLKASS